MLDGIEVSRDESLTADGVESGLCEADVVDAERGGEKERNAVKERMSL